MFSIVRCPAISAALMLALAPTPLVAQAVLRDPFAGVRVQHDHLLYQDSIPAAAAHFHGTSAERAAARASELTGKGFAMWTTTHAIGGAPLVFVRGWTGEGTGYAEVSVLIYRIVHGDSVARVFAAPVAVNGDASPRVGRHEPFALRGCVALAGANRFGFAYRLEGPGAPAALRDSLLTVGPPAQGYYAWSSKAHAFRRTKVPDAALRRACARQHPEQFLPGR